MTIAIPTDKHVVYDWAEHLSVLNLSYQIVSLYSI